MSRYVVKVIGGLSGPVWIGPSTLDGLKRTVPRDDAREFYVRAEAEREIESFAALLPDGFRFEIEEV
ncbi:MAG TPA: hypothetical protein VGP76_30115 [Planctomycetaceae bacterium]|jgi:hypothetical protein|nr:hypothetical protein [Planctomycetaceae bacterium]